jgi:riboflavin synthase
VFTGIIEEIGTVRQVPSSGAGRLTIAAQEVLGGTRVGDSIAVNGVCLTVTALDGRSFSVDLMPQTLRQSNLGRLTAGSPVNLERAVTPAGRLGGHLVQGHCDAVGQVVRQMREENALWVTIAAPPEVLRYIVPRAFVALDGASLTVARVEAGRFSVSLIPHTQQHITLAGQPIGYTVNVEVDIVAKYVERLLQGGEGGAGVNWERLAEHGFGS